MNALSIGAAELVIILVVACLCLLVIVGLAVGAYFLARRDKQE
jgi:uncharacterized protein YneF (UPF0154 family)